MADQPKPDPLPSIAALPATTVRRIGASQVLTDPSSVVKELLDNALDARANALFVDIAANTIDSIQVKDTGHGIPQEDRPLACRRYCTSKIRDYADLKDVGGKWLGFRGEALASIAEMSGALEVTTRVEGETVALKIKYGRDGELVSTENASAPVGTTVKVTNFFQGFPVRRQAALKHSPKWLAKIRRLVQAYALARPAVRFSLRVLKAKSNQSDFIYAPKRDANAEDAVLKVLGKACALQHDWTAIEMNGFEIHAFLPKPDAISSNIGNEGAFISIDARPITASRGTAKSIVSAFRKRLRKANPSLGSVRDPLFCMNIVCAPDSYDPNIEPAKDDVLFADEKAVIAAVDKLFKSYYPETLINEEETEGSVADDLSVSAEPNPAHNNVTLLSKTPSISGYEELAIGTEAEARSSSEDQPRWRSNMYGIDEEDLQFLSNSRPLVIEEEEGRQAADVSNPWTIARMNAPIKGKRPVNNKGLSAPSESSPARETVQQQQLSKGLLTPQLSSSQNMTQTELDYELQRSIQKLPVSPQDIFSAAHPSRERVPDDIDSARRPLVPNNSSLNTGQILSSQPSASHIDQSISRSYAPLASHTSETESSKLKLGITDSSSPAPHRSRRKQHPRVDDSEPTGNGRPNDVWFGQPMRGSLGSNRRRQKKSRQVHRMDDPLASSGAPPGLHSGTNQGESNRMTSKNNTDIRDFLRLGGSHPRRSASQEPAPVSSFTPINRVPQELRANSLQVNSGETHNILHSGHWGSSPRHRSEASFAGEMTNSRQIPDPLHTDVESGLDPPDIIDQLRAYAARHVPREAEAEATAAEVPCRSSVNVKSSDSQARHDKTGITSQRPNKNANQSLPDAPPSSSSSPRSLATPLQARKEQEGFNSLSLEPSVYNLQNKLSQEAATKSRLPRRRSTGNNRTRKTSKMSLGRKAHGPHNAIPRLRLGLCDVIECMKKTDMMQNSLEWGYPSGEYAFDTFDTPLTTQMLDAWALKAAQLLNHLYEQENDVDVFVILKDGVHITLRQDDEDRQHDGVDSSQVQMRHRSSKVSPDAELGDFDKVEEWVSQVNAANGIPLTRLAIPKGDAIVSGHYHPGILKTANTTSEVDFSEWLVNPSAIADNDHAADPPTGNLHKRIEPGNNDGDDDEMLMI